MQLTEDCRRVDQLYKLERVSEIATFLSRVKMVTGTWAIVMLGTLMTGQKGTSAEVLNRGSLGQITGK